MKHAVHKQKGFAIVADTALPVVPRKEHFSHEYWAARQALSGTAPGRGSAWFIESDFGPLVLRCYLRGGWVAPVSRRTYFFSGARRSRPFREYHLLAALFASGLPVPRPVAALCEHRGPFATGAILTARIGRAMTLADLVIDGAHATPPYADAWGRVGRCVRRFHDAGVRHADLNARNILLDERLEVFLIDFDRARFSPGKAARGRAGLRRLKRSLTKLWPADAARGLQDSWLQLEAGYHG